MDKGTGTLRQGCAEADWLERYRPLAMEPAIWEAVRPFVLDCARSLGLSDAAASRKIVRVLAGLAAWAKSEGLGLEYEVILDPDTVERFIAMGIAHDPSRATYRSILRRIGPKLTRKAPWEPRPLPVAERQVAVPYSASELDALCLDALAQPTRARVQTARALIALGAGAGLGGWCDSSGHCGCSDRGVVT